MDKKKYKILLFRFAPFQISYSRDFVRAAKKFALYPPLGLCLISAILKKEGYSVKIIDAEAEQIGEDDFFDSLEKFMPDIVGCTLWTPTLKGNLSILQKIKKKYPEIITIVGGPHLEIYPREVLKSNPCIDFGIVGEGEISSIKLLNNLFNKSDDFSDIGGLVYRNNNNIIQNHQIEFINNLDELPFPDFSDLKMDRYFSVLEKIPPFMYIFTSRGCPFRCNYCVNTRGSKLRFHSVEYIIKYLIYLKNKFNFKEIHFYDETFTVDKKRTKLLCEALIANNLNISWTIRTRVDKIDEEILLKLKEAGCFRITVGVESGNEKILKLMNRKITINQIEKSFSLMKKYGFEISSNFMIGYLNENLNTYKKTVNFILKLDPDFVSINITTILPKTKLFYECLENKILAKDYWHEYAVGKLDKIDIKKLRIPGQDYTVDDLDWMLADAYKKFYFRPKYIWKMLKKVKTPKTFIRYANMGLAMFFNYIENLNLFKNLFKK